MSVFTNIVVLLIASFSISACNTFEGIGKDIKKGGEKIENTADKHK